MKTKRKKPAKPSMRTQIRLLQRELKTSRELKDEAARSETNLRVSLARSDAELAEARKHISKLKQEVLELKVLNARHDGYLKRVEEDDTVNEKIVTETRKEFDHTQNRPVEVEIPIPIRKLARRQPQEESDILNPSDFEERSFGYTQSQARTKSWLDY